MLYPIHSDGSPTPFKISIPESTLQDLKARLSQTRFSNSLEGVGWNLGIERASLHQLIEHWQKFDWRAVERSINQYPAFLQEVDGTRLHYIHVKGKGGRRIPLILTHGWPSCFTEMLPLVPLLSKEVNGVSFDLVIPSLPGYGFSEQPTAPGMNITRIADLWARLMSSLGYEYFVAHGGDMGAGVVERLRANHATQVDGVHMVNVFYGYPTSAALSAPEAQYFKEVQRHQATASAYAMLQASKPHTVAVGLNDSPAGLAAWIGEKFHDWSDNHQLFNTPAGMDALCTVLTIYWATQTIGSSQRLYWEAFLDVGVMSTPPRQGPPMAIVTFASDILPAPREWAERWFDIAHWKHFEQGGHFPALEVPTQLASDLREFFSALPIRQVESAAVEA